MIIERPKYLDMLVRGQGNGLVKIVTGGRRSGKSFLLFNLFHNYLLEHGVGRDHLIELSLDDWRNRNLCNPDVLLDYMDTHIIQDGKTSFVILDEIQMVDNFVGILLSLMHMRNVEIYVSGSNSKFLSKDVTTEFRGRGQEIRVWPLTFAEFFSATGGAVTTAWKEYYTYGGLPQILQLQSEEEKENYLHEIFEVTYLKDIIDRNRLKNADGLQELVRILASTIGSPTNPLRISNTFASASKIAISDKTVNEYIKHLSDAFMIEESLRYDVKGRKYIGSENKYYFTDMGLRNIVLNMRQQEETHIMENVIYNELRSRGYLVDVGVVKTLIADADGTRKRSSLEIDFVVNRGAKRVYIQSAFRMPDSQKVEQEKRSLKTVNDMFRKLIIVGDDIRRKIDEDGIVTMSVYDFLLDKKSIEILM